MINLSVTRKLQLMLAVSFVVLITMAVSGYAVGNSYKNSMTKTKADIIPSLGQIDKINETFLKIRLNVLYHLWTQDLARKKELENQVSKLEDQIKADIAKYEKDLISDDTDKTLLDEEKKYFFTYFDEIKLAMEKSRTNDYEGTVAVVAKATGNMQKLSEAIDAHKQYNEKLEEASFNEAIADGVRGEVISLTLLIISSIVMAALGWFIIREIKVRMSRLSGFMNEINSSQDFTSRIRVTRMDELGSAGDAFNRLLDKLQENFKSVADNARSVSSASTQLTSVSSGVAGASRLQAEAASNMASTVEEMTVSVNHVAERAHETSLLVSESGKLASDGEIVISSTSQKIMSIAETVHQTADLIADLEKSSQQIASIVQVIKEVADQTNLLALNAAIEAARAGEQGRGFAVVADEVRKLAERTSLSTQEIAKTVTAIRERATSATDGMNSVVGQVTSGVELAKQANETMQKIGETARNAAEMVGEIATAIREQGAATDNIAGQVEKIAQMSEESSGAAEQCSSSAKDLDKLAASMLAIVNTYRLEGTSGLR